MPQLRHDGFIGEGTLYIRRLDRADLGLIQMGNATSFSVAVESEVKERLSKMRENYGAVLNTVILPKSGELKITLDDFNEENFAMVFMGALTKEQMTAQTVSDEEVDVDLENVFIIFVAGFPRKPKRPFADRYSTYARSFSKAACSFPTGKSCALLPIASAIPQNGAIRFAWQSLPPHPSTPVPTKQMPYPCNHRQQGLFVPPQDYPCHVPMPADSLFYP